MPTKRTKINVPSHEQETSISFMRPDANMSVNTNDSTFKTMLKKRGYELPDEDVFGGITILIPIKNLTIRANTNKPKTKRKKRTLSPEHLEKLKAGREKAKEEQPGSVERKSWKKSSKRL